MKTSDTNNTSSAVLYSVELATKGQEDRYLGGLSVYAPAQISMGARQEFNWLKKDQHVILKFTKEEALRMIRLIVSAKITESPHDLYGWSLLKFQACIKKITNEFCDPFLHTYDHYVYLGLYNHETEVTEKQWILSAYDTQTSDI